MSDQEKPNIGGLVPKGRYDLAPAAQANPLVSRGMADLAKLQDCSESHISRKQLLDRINKARAEIHQERESIKARMLLLQALQLLRETREASRQSAPAPLPGHDTPSARLPASDPPLHPPGQDSTPKGSL